MTEGKRMSDDTKKIQIIQQPSDEDEVLRVVDPKATTEEIRAGTSGCVNHLCGCS